MNNKSPLQVLIRNKALSFATRCAIARLSDPSIAEGTVRVSITETSSDDGDEEDWWEEEDDEGEDEEEVEEVDEEEMEQDVIDEEENEEDQDEGDEEYQPYFNSNSSHNSSDTASAGTTPNASLLTAAPAPPPQHSFQSINDLSSPPPVGVIIDTLPCPLSQQQLALFRQHFTPFDLKDDTDIGAMLHTFGEAVAMCRALLRRAV